MNNQLSEIIEQVKSSDYSFCKFVSPNDAGETGGHQAGLYIPKNSIKLLFDKPGIRGENLERLATINWHDGTSTECRFVYYGQGTRNEYRITRLGRSFKIDDFVIIIKKSDSNYFGYVLNDQSSIQTFLDEFGLTAEDTNSLIPINNDKEVTVNFKPRARLLLQLGDQLIKNESIALIELVKNSYDADANRVDIYMENIDDEMGGIIIIEDDGYGMDLETVLNVWMEPGSDFKTEKFTKREASPKYNRLPIGEKGIGRFGVHKLGNRIEMTTKKLNQNEVFVSIDWEDFNNYRYLEQVPIKVIERSKPKLFKDSTTGTNIIIKHLRSTWTRGTARNVKRSITSLVSPFESNDSFKADFAILDKPGWFEGLLEWEDVKHYALFHFEVTINNGVITKFLYEFLPWSSMPKISSKKIDQKNQLVSQYRVVQNETGEVYNYQNLNIGEIKFEGYIFDRDAFLMRLGVSDKMGFKKYLDGNSGVRVFRDGMRIYDYGEPENDWLDLNMRRVNQPTKRISKNILLGAVYLDRAESTDLIEKTNREGFVDNTAYQAFKSSILHSLGLIEIFRYSDKMKLREIYGPTAKSQPVLQVVGDLKDYVESQIEDGPIRKEIIKYLVKIEDDYKRISENLLKAAGAGLSMSVVIHEVEKIILEVQKVLEKEQSSSRLTSLVKHLSSLIDGYSDIIRNSTRTNENLIDVIDQALFNTEFRRDSHSIEVIRQYKNFPGNPKTQIAKSLLIGCLMNIIDNSIFWMEKAGRPTKKLFIGLSEEEEGYTNIVIADNGTGFLLPTEDIIQPFVSAKPGGIGLGLHIASEIMIAHGGKLSFPDWGDFDVPADFETGATIAFAFKK